MKKHYKFFLILFFVFSVSFNQKILSQTYSSLPFTEDFENDWVNKDGTRDVPNSNWKNSPATTDSSWSREDDGVLRGAWSNQYGMYDFAGANGSLHSARFHSFATTSGKSGKLDLYIDFSGFSDAKTLAFWYFNDDGTDKLEVFLSTDGGSSFGNAITTLGIASSWTKISVNLGTSVASSCVIRFKATSDKGLSDIGLDDISITTPTTPVKVDFRIDRATGIVPVPIKFTDISTPDVTSWIWDFNNDGITDASSQNPIYTFKTPGTYTVKLTASKTGSSNVVTKTGIITVTSSQYAPLPFSETFDATWINRDSIRDVPSVYFLNNPISGTNSWSRDDDIRIGDPKYGSYKPAAAISSSHSARFHSYFTYLSGTLDAYVNFSTQSGNKTLTFNYINTTGADKLEVMLSVDGGTTFDTPISTQGIAADWTKVSIDLGNINTATGVVRFKAIGDNGITDIGIDEVYIENPSESAVHSNFVADATKGIAPLTINFSDLSNGIPTSWNWDFNGDGTIDETSQNPAYIYTTPGIYTAKLTSSKNGSTDTKVRSSYIFVSGYASLPFSENFEKQWLDRDDVRDVPSFNSINKPATGLNSWSRDDDGYKRGAWNNVSGAYSPSGANGSSHSARFHSNGTLDIGTLDFYIDFSTLSGDKTLTFWYINTNGTDSLKVYLSSDGGISFGSVISTQLISPSWTQVTVDLGNINTPNGIIRFKATGDQTNTDIGLDEISVGTTGVSPINTNFVGDITDGMAPLSVNFTDQSTGSPTSWAWDFNNDGIIEATAQNPSYTFTNPGMYTVTLMASKTGAKGSGIKTSYIFAGGYASLPFNENFENQWGNRGDVKNVPSAFSKNTPANGYNSWSKESDAFERWGETGGGYTPVGANGSSSSARFHSYNTPLNGSLDLSIDFSTATGNKTLSFWYINTDGTDSLTVSLSTDGGATFGNSLVKKTLSANWSQVTVNLGDITTSNGVLRFTAFGDYGNTDMGIDEISVLVPVVTQFSANKTFGQAPLAVDFTDQSTGNPTSWIWDFNNDGTIDATAQNATYTFSNAGIYTVKLIATKTGSSDILIKTNYITVIAPINAQFTADNIIGVAPLTVAFTDQSTGDPTAWSWDFNNDGTIDATTQNPSYTFTSPGTYEVKLVASKTGSSGTLTKTGYITVTPPVVAMFTSNVITGVAPLTVNFTDQSTGNPTAWSWDFNNDGTIDATTQNPSFIFSNAGVYTIKLTVSKTGSADAATKPNYITVSSATGISATIGQSATKIYPNPSDGVIFIELDQSWKEETVTFQIYNQASKIMLSTKLPWQKLYKFDLIDYPAGIYTVKLTNKTQVFTSKIIIK